MNNPVYVRAWVTDADSPQWASYRVLSDHVVFVLASGLEAMFPFRESHEYEAYVLWSMDGSIGRITFTDPNNTNTAPRILSGSQVLGIIDNSHKASKEVAA